MICLVFISGCSEKQTEKTLNEQETVKGSNLEDMLSEQEMNDTVLEIAQRDSSVSSFISNNPSYSYEITVLDTKTIEPLAEKYPVIYDGLPEKTLYRIEYQNGKGMLVIVDLENETVLRSFRTTGVSLQ